MTSSKASDSKSFKDTVAQPAGPADSMEELAGLVFDVPCANCAGMVFSLPYVADTEHLLQCHKCGEQTRILVDERGGIVYLPEEVAQARMEAALKILRAQPSSAHMITCPWCKEPWFWTNDGLDYRLHGRLALATWPCFGCKKQINVGIVAWV